MELHSTLQRMAEQKWDQATLMAKSPDMNPIEHLWAILDRAVWKKSRKPTSREELRTRLREAWAEISKEKISELVSSMPETVKALESANGKTTKY